MIQPAMKFVSNSALFVLCPVIVLTTELVVSKFSTATAAGTRKEGGKVLLNRYGPRMYNTNFKPESK